jgi:hypothetical protein
MEQASIRRPLVAIAVAVTLMAASLILLTPNAARADNSFEQFDGIGSFVRKGVTYQLEVEATSEPNGSVDFNLSIRQYKNPRGLGKGSRSVAWIAAIDEMTANNNLSKATMHATSEDMAGRGAINMSWTPTKPLDQSCKGHNHSRKGRMEGKFVFDTKTSKFGKIRKPILEGFLFSSDGDCFISLATDCPTPSRGLSASNTETYFSANRNAGSKIAYFLARRDLTQGQWGESLIVSSTLPRANLILNDSLTTGAVQGLKGTFLSGESSYSSSGPPSNDDGAHCGDSKVWYTTQTHGTFTPGFRSHFILGPAKGIPSGVNEASASKLRVRDAPSGFSSSR